MSVRECNQGCARVGPAAGPAYEPDPNWRSGLPTGAFTAHARVTASGAHPTTGCPDRRTWEFVISSDDAGRISASVYDVTLPGWKRELGTGFSPSTGKISTVIGPQAYLSKDGIYIRGTNDASFDIWAPGDVVPLSFKSESKDTAPELPAENKYVSQQTSEQVAGRRPKV